MADSVSARKLTPNDYITDGIAGLLGYLPGYRGDTRGAYQKAKDFTGLLDWTPLGTPEMLHQAGGLLATGARDKSLGGLLGGAGMAALGAFPSARKALPLVKQAAKGVLKELPMDEASRMARAESLGFNKDVFHGTHADIDAFDPNAVDLGVHVGTTEQATNRLKSTADIYKSGRSGNFREGANVLPLKVNLGKMLDMPDVGMWKDSHAVAQALSKKGFSVKDIADEALEIKHSYGDMDEWLDSPENRSALDDLRSHIEGQGYGSIRYKNQVENEYGELTSMLPHVKSARDKINAELKAIDGAVRGRMPNPPDVGDPNADQVLQKFLDAKPDHYMQPEEAARIKMLEDELYRLSSDANSYADPHSYIVLDPAKTRSRFAMFDPKNINSKDILAGVPLAIGGAATLSGLLGPQPPQKRREY